MLAGGAHDNAPDKKPAARLRTLAMAGQCAFLSPRYYHRIGETWEERAIR